MKLKLYQVDAFTNEVFKGNPAAVCQLEQWLPDNILQYIAMENNLAETVFFVKQTDGFDIRWFTPVIEVDLCGHATLAAAYVLFNYENYQPETIKFHSHRSGLLEVRRQGDFLSLNFPTDSFEPVPITMELEKSFNKRPLEVYKGKTDYLFVYASAADIVNITAHINEISKLNARGVMITAPGNEVDFVSRFFAPQSGITEDPVTGSAHTTLIPYWSKRLNKTELTAMQLSARGGYLKCKYLEDRVAISGEAKLYLKGEIYLHD